MMDEERFEGLERRLNRSSLIVAAIAMPLLFFLHSGKAAFGMGAGAALSYVNFRGLKQAIDFVIVNNVQGKSRNRVLSGFVARYALIALFLYVTIRSSALDLLFVFAGLLVYVAAVLIECVSEVFRVVTGDYRNGRA